MTISQVSGLVLSMGVLVIYTPQASIDGTIVPEYSGDVSEVKTLVRQASVRPSVAQSELSVLPTVDPEVVQLKANTRGETGGAKVLALLVEDGLHSEPYAGENSGRELKHTHVVRRSQAYEKMGKFNFSVGHEIDRSNS